MRLRQTLISAFVLVLALGVPLQAGEVAKADLDILGLGLEVDRNPVTTAVDVPAYVQTLFGGKTGDDAPPANGLSALGELTGPGITTPITIATTPGRQFALPALHEKGEYALQNIRLVGSSGEFLQQAVPSFAIVNVTDVLKTQVRVRQLSPEELRQRGITIDSRNFEVYEYTFVFGVEQSTVEIPYPVIIDKRTHEVTPVPYVNPYSIPPIPQNQRPPRFAPPSVEAFELGEGPPEGGGPPPGGERPARPSIPAALVVPTGFGVLHQFFAVILQVDNGAPEGSNIRLDSVTATINAPTQLRIAKVMPAVSIGQPVPIHDEKTGATFLVAGGRGNAEWSLEALKAGTHTVNIEVNATYQKPGQADFPLRGHVSTSLVVSDPRFQINFSHPDTVRKDEKYTAYAFVTNLSPSSQTVSLDLSYIPLCSSGASADNICRDEGTPATKLLTIPPGGMEPVPYKLNSKINGRVFAAAGVASDETIGASVKLTMGVSQSGIPLSPATLVMPYYARYLPGEFIDANMQLLGLGYSLSTAPLNKQTAAFPRVIKTDVFIRAQQIARAGQRIFIARKNLNTSDPLENREPFFHLALDLLGNTERMDQSNTAPEMREWDDLRQAEAAGRRAGAAMARQLEAQAFTNGTTPKQFVDEFAAATSHRTGYLFAYAHGAPVSGNTRPYKLTVEGVRSGFKVAELAETCRSAHEPASEAPLCVRTFPYSELTQLNAGGDHGELALVGRWREEDVRVTVVPAAASFKLHLIWPEVSDTALLRTDVDISNATIGQPVSIVLRRGEKTLIVSGATATPLVNAIPQTALRVIGAAQDLHLDEHGHIVSMLFNRPVKVSDASTLRDRLALTVTVPKANYSITRKNAPSTLLQIPGAALQDDAKIINISFDKTLSRNAQYKIAIEQIQDLTVPATPLFAKSDIVPRIDNDRPGAILTGRVLRGDNSVIPNVVVKLFSNNTQQIDATGSDGRFLYEFVPRDADSGIFGNYTLSADAEGKTAKLEGSVRLPGEVHTVNLQFLGRGIARGQVRYSDGEVIPNVWVTIGSTMFDQARSGVTDANGNYEIGDLPVGPLTFSVNDKDGRPTYAANQIRIAGEVVTQDLVIVKREPPGLGNIRVVVKRSDNNTIVAGALVGVWAQGYALRDGYTGSDGSLTFSDIPAGIVSVLAADFSISRNGAGVEVELRKDQTLEVPLVLSVPQANVVYASLEGVVSRDDPAAPGDTTKDQIAPGAIITIDRLPSVTAGPDGSYVFTDLTLDVSDRRVTVFDPATGRRGYFAVPTLVAGSNHFNMRLRSTQPAGIATMRVRLYGPQGEPVTGYRVIWPGYPATPFTPKGTGIYELGDMRVPQQIDVVAVPSNANGPYGEQATSGYVRVDFHGQVGVTDLRLPGSGTVVVRVEIEQPCSTPPCYAPAIGPVALSYSVWDEAEQGFRGKTVEGQPDPNTGLVTFTKIPARQNLGVATVRNPAGYAAAVTYLSYDGDVRNVTLRLKTIGDVTGRVYAHDGVTPVSGATVRIYSDRATYAPTITNPDGTFRFAGFPAGTGFTIIADLDRDGVYRTGVVGGGTPSGGGPVSNLLIFMRTQSTVEGQVLDNLTGQKVPLARYWLRELAWPYRSIGSPQDPLFADINGRFLVSNVFTGDFRITAVSPDNQEIRGDYQGRLSEEGDASQRSIQVRIGGAGSGAVSVTVVDPLLGFQKVANAEVALYRGGGRFDFTSTNDNGVAFFESVPVGRYTIVAYSKAAGRAGHAVDFDVFNGNTTPVTVQLEFRGYVSGTLTDPESEPTPGLPVKGMPVQMQATGISAAASTDVAGFFEFNGVPEGPFYLNAFEIGTHRRAIGPTNLFISRLVPEQKNIKLELERTATLTVKTYLPNDTGGEGELAPLVEVTVWQGDLIYGPVPYYRGQQGNPLVFRKMLASWGYGIEVRELGGEQRVVKSGGGFGGALTKEHHITFPTSGNVEVRVVDGNGVAVQDAKVTIDAGFGRRTMYTPASGIVTLPGVPFGWVSASATKGNVSASGGGSLASRSQTLVIPLNLGSNASVEGGVDAEVGNGAPSVGTRVLLNITTSLSPAIRLETLTDSAGNYRFTGIPVGNTNLTLTFYGPDDTTIGATRSVPIANGTTGTVVIPRVRIDATPPRVLSIDPPANATSVSPSTAITITFSEQIASGYLNSGWFQLIATDDSSFVGCAIEPSVRPDGTFIVRMIPPPAPAGQKFPLKSNVIYRISIPQGIRDTTGNMMTTPIGSSFTTVNYTEPAVVKIDPAENAPIPASTTFRIKFNKFIDLASFDAGNGGVLKLERLEAYKGTAVETINITKFLDPADPSTLVVAPQGVAIAESAFYRLTVSGVRDTQTPPNVQKDPRVFEFFSYDTKKPVAKITSSDDTLVSALLYSATVSVTDEGTTTESNDIAYVDWLDANGTAIARVRTKPFSYSFAAPATTSGTTFTLKAVATDLSGNSSPEADVHTWQVLPNEAPRNIVVTNSPTAEWPTHPVTTRVAFTDEGVSVTVALELRGINIADGSELRKVLGSKNVTRASTSPNVTFPEAVFTYTLPEELKDGPATIVATLTDSVNKVGTGSAPLTIKPDENPPQLVSFLPAAESRYKFNTAAGSYTIEVKAKDVETGISRAVISVNGVEQSAVTATFDGGTGITTWRKTITVPPRNADTRIPIVVTVYDKRNKSVTDTHEVIYERVDDATLPTAAWITPLDGAALPTGQTGWLTTLRVRANDDVKVTSVRFDSSAIAGGTINASLKSGTTDIYEAKAALAFPADKSPFVIKAVVTDADPSHDVELPITVDPVDVTPVISADINIVSGLASQYEGKSVLVRGARVYISVPLTLKDLILVDGAVLSNPEETKLDLTITDHLFVDADSAVNVSGKGYLGGWRVAQGNTIVNGSPVGRTLGGTTAGGATSAGGSHAGIGGSYTGTTNATYGSINNPTDFGSGGTGWASNQPGGNGGGVVLLRGGSGLSRFVLAGPVRADADTSWSAGAGGSVQLQSRVLITGPWTRITANGADESESNIYDLGGGGGRIAIRASERFDLVSLNYIQARGGRNGAWTGGTGEGASFVDGGAGTIYLERPGAAASELILSSFDDRYPNSTHRTAGTPLAGALSFGAFTIGPRVLARFDVAPPANVTVDATAKLLTPDDLPTVSIASTTPAANSDIAQNTSVTASYTAASVAGIRQVRTILSVQPSDVVSFPSWPTNIASASSTISVPTNAPLGTTTLKVRVTDRAGRVAETATVPFNIINNAAPVIDSFVVTPADETYANRTISISATASDDISVSSITLSSNIGSVSSGTATKPTATTMARSFTVAIPVNAPSNTDIVLTLSASDGFPGRVATTQEKRVRIKKDEVAPVVTVTKPTTNQEIVEGTGATFDVEANVTDADVAVKSVSATFDGTTKTMSLVSGTLYRANFSVPSVDGVENIAKTVTVSASDYDNNVATKDVNIFIKPLIDPNAPALSWVCQSPGSIFPTGYQFTMQLNAVPSSSNNGVSTVIATIDGAPGPINATRVGSSNTWQFSYTIPAGTADGTTLNVRVDVRSVGSNESTLLGNVTVVAGQIDVSTQSNVSPLDPGYQDRHVVVRSSGILVLNGEQHLRNLVVLSGGKVIQTHPDKGNASLVSVERLFVACGATIDVTGWGYAPRTTYPGERVAATNGAASHIGIGGWRADSGSSYGSIYRPKESGAGEYNRAWGGGAVRIQAQKVVLDGGIYAEGQNNTSQFEGGAAGGSVWIRTDSIRGTGRIEVDGGDAAAFNSNNAGGGAIAIEYTDPGSIVPTLQSKSGAVFNPYGGAGSLYVKGPSSTYGDVRFDNTGRPNDFAPAMLPAFGTQLVDSIPTPGTIVLKAPASIQPYFGGHYVRVQAPDGAIRGIWRIASVTNPTTIVLESSNVAWDVRVGDTLRGAYRFDSLTLQNAKVYTPDLVLVGTTPVVDSTSTLITGNDAAPVVNASLVTFSKGLYGTIVTGAAGTVSDPDKPVDIWLKNANRPINPGDWTTSGTTLGTVGGFSVRKITNGQEWSSASTVRGSNVSAYISCRPSQANNHLDCALLGGTRSYDWGIFNNGTWQLWIHGSPTSITGTYNTSTVFRVELAGGVVRFLKDGAQVHQLAADSTVIRPYVGIRYDGGEMNSIMFSVDNNVPARLNAPADGSFTLGVDGAPGDPLTLTARDAHYYSLSSDTSFGAIPADFGVAGVTFNPTPVTGGRTAAGTVTLRSAAGTSGALVRLTSSSASATVPATITVPAGQLSAPFNVTTTPVSGPTPVTITATWGGAGVNGLLQIEKDAIAPAVTITAPAANAVFNEGSSNKIAVQVTAVDDDSGVARVYATIDGQNTELAKNAALGANVWTGNVPAPFVDGTENVARNLVFTALDRNDNSGTATVSVQIKPVVDGGVPAISWACAAANSLYPPGYGARLKVTATAPNATNQLQKIEFIVTDAGGASATYTAASAGTDQYEYVHTIPDVADGTRYTVRAIATTAAGTTAFTDGSFTVIKGGIEIKTNTTIASNNTSYDNQNIVVWDGVTVTIAGQHTFKRFAALPNSVVNHNNLDRLNITVDQLYVACGAAIDANGRGYAGFTSYPGESGPGDGTGGSHIGQGGLYAVPIPATFGSVHQPQEHGGGGDGGAGGGVVRIVAGTVTVDGAIRANGVNAGEGGGAGGSVWITTGKIDGVGSIEASGGQNHYGEGAGGAVSIAYTDAASVLPVVRAQTAVPIGEFRPGGAGSIYVKKPGSTHGDLTIDNGGVSSGMSTVLPSLGSGVAQSGTAGATLATNRANNIQAWFVGHWVEITNASGALKGTWRIASVSGKNATLAPNTAGETISLAEGDKWQGVYRFDTVTARGVNLVSSDPIRTSEEVIEGRVDTALIEAATLRVKKDATLTSSNLTMNVTGELLVEAGGAIDVSGRGPAGFTAWPGETSIGDGTGGSHIGQGGFYANPIGSTYGSVYRPMEGGGGGDGGAGGGVIRIVAGSVKVEGAIRANGVNGGEGGGAGGSVWITTGRISGAGSVEAIGGQNHYGEGGGGAVSVEYTDGTSLLPTLIAHTGIPTGEYRPGGAGSVYVKKPGSIYGDLTIDNLGHFGAVATVLPSLGNGVAQSGTSGPLLVTTRAKDIQSYFIGHWVEIKSATGALKGTWRIASVSGKTATLAPNGAGETISLASGDQWQGVYLFDNVVVLSGTLYSSDPLRATSEVIEGRLETDRIEAGTLRLKPTASVTSANVAINVSGAMTVDLGAFIDTNGRGYGGFSTYPGETVPGDGTGGSHIGQGGFYASPLGTTFGSVCRPMEAGGGGDGGAGGGVVRITAGTLALDGTIRSNGVNGGEGGGAGGSVWITAGRISGGGAIEAVGGQNHYGEGAGGAVSIEYTDATSAVPAVRAHTGIPIGELRPGGPGTIYVKKPASTHGDLTSDNSGYVGQATVLPALGTGAAQAGTAGATLVTDRSTNVPAWFVGHWVEITSASGPVKGLWRVLSISGKSVTLEPNGTETISLVPGDLWRGVYRFDALTLRFSKMQSNDAIRYTTLDKDSSSTLTNNPSAPVFAQDKLAQIVIDSTPSQDYVAAPAGTVSDPDQPVRMTATNVRTAAQYTGNANADGSFRVAVAGVAGDTFTVRATDSHALPLSSPAVPVNGTIVERNAVGSISLSSSTVSGGTSVVATLRLTTAARSGGATVAISSSSSTAVVPATVTVPADAWSTQFTIATTVPASHVAAVITAATTNAVTATLNVAPPSAVLTSLTLSSSSIEGGGGVDATVTLGASAPSGGAVVTLLSNSPNVRVPVNVTIPAGSTSTTFSVATSRVGASTSGTVSAIYGDTKSATLTVTACTTAMELAAKPASTPLTIRWVDEAPPAGASGDATFDNTQSAQDQFALHFAARTGSRSWQFGGGPVMNVAASDSLVAYMLVNPCNPPRQILFSWTDGGSTWRASWGQGRVTPASSTTLLGSLPSSGAWTRIEIPAKSLGITSNKAMTGLTITVDGGEAWFDAIGNASCALPAVAKPSYLPTEVVWWDDALPQGASEIGTEPFPFTTAQAASGTRSAVASVAGGIHKAAFLWASSGMTLAMDDVIVAYVLVDPCNPPLMLELEFNTAPPNTNPDPYWWRRAYWGDNNDQWGNPGTPERRRMGPMPEAGKWVRLEIPVSSMQMAGMTITGMKLVLSEGQAWIDRVGKAQRVNLATGKKTSMSSWLGPGEVAYPSQPDPCPFNCSENAIDGNVDSYAHTARNTPNQWWQVDLGAIQPIEYIDLWNSGFQGCCYDRLRDFWVFVSDVPFASNDLVTTINQPGVGAYYYQPQAIRPSTFEVRRTGRYVRIQNGPQDYLHPGEIQVWAPLTPGNRNLSAGTRPSQSNVFESRWPELANNANTNGWWGYEYSMNHTFANGEDWYSVDLGSVQPISSIDIWGRLDWPDQMPRSFYILVSDTPFASTSLSASLADPNVSAYYYGSPGKTGVYTIPINRTGRFVRAQYTTAWQAPITFAEFWVWSGNKLLGTAEAPLIQPAANSAPVFPAAVRPQIVYVSNDNGDFIVGPAGAVTDPDTPILVQATNDRTGKRFLATAAANGSFSIQVTGGVQAGDTFTLRASDSHPNSLISGPVPVSGTFPQFSAITSLAVDPATVGGGSSATGTVRLDNPVAFAVVVTLSSSSAFATVPATVTIPAGFSSAQFPISTSAVSASQAATITASYRGTKSAPLTITPASNVLASLTLSASTIEGGASLNGTVTLGAPAPAGGALVMLFSDNPNVGVPPSVLVPEGSAQYVFTVTTSRVGMKVSTNLSAIYGATKSATLDLTACAAMGTPAAPASAPLTNVWFDDDKIPNSTVTDNAAVFDATQVAAGAKSLHFTVSGNPSRGWSDNGGQTLTFSSSDSFVFYALVNPCNPPRQLMVSFGDGTTIYRAVWGESLIDNTLTVTRRGAMFPGGQWQRVEIPAKALGVTSTKTLTGISIWLYGGEMWLDRFGTASCSIATAPKPQYGANEVVWYDDALPAGASQFPPTSTRSNFNWDTTQVASGANAHLERTQDGLHEHAFENASASLPLKIGDLLFTYVFLDPCNPPKEVMLSFQDQNGNWEHRAYWGESLNTTWGSEGAASRYRMGPLPKLGEWVRLEIPVSVLGLDDMSVKGNGLVLWDGQAWFDRVGKVSRVNVALNKPARQSSTEFGQVASQAFDGNLNTINHTVNQLQPWVEVDLGSSQPIQHIQIWNRLDSCCITRLRDFAVYISDTPVPDTWGPAAAAANARFVWTGSAQPTMTIEVNRVGRYIRLQQWDTENLNIREMAVFAPPSPAVMNVGGGAKNTYSSYWDSYHAGSNAVNGHWNSPGGSGSSIFHTAQNGSGLQWWMADLGAIEAIDTIELFNRPESQYQYNLQDFYVILSDTPFPSPDSQDVNLFLNHPGAYVFYYGFPSFWNYSLPVNRTARFIRVHQKTAGVRALQLAEVRVWAQKKLVAALAAPAPQSSR